MIQLFLYHLQNTNTYKDDENRRQVSVKCKLEVKSLFLVFKYQGIYTGLSILQGVSYDMGTAILGYSSLKTFQSPLKILENQTGQIFTWDIQ